MDTTALATANRLVESTPLFWASTWGDTVLFEDGVVLVAAPALFSAFGNFAPVSEWRGVLRPVGVEGAKCDFTVVTRSLALQALKAAEAKVAQADRACDLRCAKQVVRLARLLLASV